MIAGVRIKELKIHSDDRGFLTEIFKESEKSYFKAKQATFTKTYPGVIKAFHWHKEQSDIWFVVSGNAQVVLYDLRDFSSTEGETQVVYMGEGNRLALLIPPGVAHGYRVLGSKPVGLFYLTNQVYDPENSDEERMSFDDPTIGFDWETKNR